MSSKPRMWSAWPCVNRMASSRPSPTRSACWRKSGVVSMTTFCPLRESSIEGRNRLSRGSFERHTRHVQPSVGTPMDVPEPRTVIVSGAEGMMKAPESTVTRYRVTAPGILGARLGFSFRRLCRNRLIDLQVGHLQLAEEVQEEVVFFRRKIAFGFFVQSVEHVNQLACGLGIDHRLAGAGVGVSAEHHCCVAPQHSDKIFECGNTFWRLRRGRSGRCLCCLGRCGWALWGFLLRFPLYFLGNFLAQFALRGKRTPVDNAKRIFLLMVGQGTFLSYVTPFQSITGCQFESSRGAGQERGALVKGVWGTVKWIV